VESLEKGLFTYRGHDERTVESTGESQLPSHTDRRSSNACDRIDYAHFKSNSSVFLRYLLRQEPVVIDHVPIIDHDDLLTSLREIQLAKVGVKLSPDREFEGIDLLTNWGMASTQFVPREVLDHRQSPDLVVVRAAHRDMRIRDLMKLFVASSSALRRRRKESDTADAGTTNDIINAYVEYLAIKNDPSSPLRALLDKLLPLNSSMQELESASASVLSNALPRYIDHTLQKGKAHIWIGDGRAIGKLHFDPFDNLLFQVEGSKTFLLADPQENERFLEGHMRETEIDVELAQAKSKYLYDWQLDDSPAKDIRGTFKKHTLSESTSMVHSPVASLRVALNSLNSSSTHTSDDSGHYNPHDWQEVVDRYPQARTIPQSIMECSVPAGSAIFVPSFWWHEVESHPGESLKLTKSVWPELVGNEDENASVDISLNVAVNFWFDPLFTKEFPCSTCRKHLNSVYRKFLSSVYANK
jgi:jumonji domain-containing protein 7